MTSTFVVYDATGEIVRWGFCPTQDLAAQAGAGQSVVAGVGDPRTHYVANGEIVAYTPEQAAAKAAKSIFWTWDNATMAAVDPRTLDELKAAAWNGIKAAREAAMAAPLATPYGTFDADADSRSNITDAVLMLQTLEALGTPSDITFTLSDNTDVVLTTSEMVTVGLLLGQQVQTAYGVGRTLRAQIDSATTAEEVGAVVWPA